MDHPERLDRLPRTGREPADVVRNQGPAIGDVPAQEGDPIVEWQLVVVPDAQCRRRSRQRPFSGECWRARGCRGARSESRTPRPGPITSRSVGRRWRSCASGGQDARCAAGRRAAPPARRSPQAFAARGRAHALAHERQRTAIGLLGVERRELCREFGKMRRSVSRIGSRSGAGPQTRSESDSRPATSSTRLSRNRKQCSRISSRASKVIRGVTTGCRRGRRRSTSRSRAAAGRLDRGRPGTPRRSPPPVPR